MSHLTNDPNVTEHAQGNASKHILYASIPVFLFEHVRKHTSYTLHNKHLPLDHVDGICADLDDAVALEMRQSIGGIMYLQAYRH